MVCKEDGIERPCTKKDFEFQSSYKDMVCQSGGKSVFNNHSTIIN